MRHRPAANEAMPRINRSVVLVAENGNGDVGLVLLAFIIHFGLLELHRPSGVMILLSQLCWLGLPVVGYLSYLISASHHRYCAAAVWRQPRHRQSARPWPDPGIPEITIKTGKQVLNGACLTRCSRNSQIVLASGTLSPNLKPKKRMKERRSWIWNSAWSSDRL